MFRVKTRRMESILPISQEAAKKKRRADRPRGGLARSKAGVHFRRARSCYFVHKVRSREVSPPRNASVHCLTHLPGSPLPRRCGQAIPLVTHSGRKLQPECTATASYANEPL